MACISVKNVKIKGLSACVPSRVEENIDFPGLPKEELEKYIATTGVERRHCAIHDGSICTSDLCQKAAEKLIDELGWEKSSIDLLVFVSQTADYKMPATAIVLQDKMGLPTSCLAFDISLGCSGFVVGLGTVGSMMSSGAFHRAILMVGNTASEYASPEDRSMKLLSGDAGTVTALEYSPDFYDQMDFNFMSDGSGRQYVIMPDGGSRNPVNSKSFEMEDYGNGIRRTRLHVKMIGDEVFSYGTFFVPRCYRELIEKTKLQPDKVDYFLFHQANKFLCEALRKKLKAPVEKVPYNINEFGNTSGATIPLLMVTNLGKEMGKRPLELVLATIGIGFSLGTGRISLQKGEFVCPELLTL